MTSESKFAKKFSLLFTRYIINVDVADNGMQIYIKACLFISNYLCLTENKWKQLWRITKYVYVKDNNCQFNSYPRPGWFPWIIVSMLATYLIQRSSW